MRKGRIGNLKQAREHAVYTFEGSFSTLSKYFSKFFSTSRRLAAIASKLSVTRSNFAMLASSCIYTLCQIAKLDLQRWI